MTTNEMYDTLENGVRTIGEIAALHPGTDGTVSVIFLTYNGPAILTVGTMDLAEVGIEVKIGSQFGATVVVGVTGSYATGFSAIEQLDPVEVSRHLAGL